MNRKGLDLLAGLLRALVRKVDFAIGKTCAACFGGATRCSLGRIVSTFGEPDAGSRTV